MFYSNEMVCSVSASLLLPFCILHIYLVLFLLQLCRKGIKVTIVCPGPVKTSSSPEASTSGAGGASEVMTFFYSVKNLNEIQ